ncbi:dioxygenase [Streptomyces sp. 142MFCol3.1]|uniref:dioxygenase n=1 Tax=Streptomyces sp. 142MFCol3.1 TaxID=1172179 RepID=UPI000427EF2B|nr:dioxygenase [Streptomyces sp. 142MFCol3.1]
MTPFTTDITRAVGTCLDGTADPRPSELLSALTRHLHDFARRTDPSMQERERAAALARGPGVAGPFRHACFDLVLEPR